MIKKDKSMEQLLAELKALRKQVKELQQAQELQQEKELQQAQDALPRRAAAAGMMAPDLSPAEATPEDMSEDALQRREEHYRLLQITGYMNDVIIRTDTGGIIQYISPSVANVLGYEPEERLGRSAFELVHPDDGERLRSVFENGINNASSGRIECRYRHKDGHYVWLEWVGKVLENETGTVTGAVFCARDITERKQAETLYRTIFETTGTATLISEDDTTIFLANEEFTVISGYSREEIEGKKSWTEFFTPGDLERMTGYHHARRIDPQAPPSQYEAGLINRSGTIKKVVMKVAIIPGTRRSVLSFLDITSLKQAEEELRQRAAELQAVFKALPDLYFRLGADGTFLDVLAGRLCDLHLPIGELLGKRIQDTSKRLAGQFQEAIDRALGTRSVVMIEYSLTINGEEKCFEARFTPLLEDQVIVVVRNITYRKNAERALQERAAELQAVFKALPDIYFRLGADGTFLDVLAGRLCDLYLPIGELLGKRIQDTSKRLAGQFQEAIDRALGTRSVVMIEYSLTINGEEKCFEARFTPLLEDQVIVVVRNINDRKKSERELREREEQLRQITDNMLDMVCQTDAEGIIQYASPSNEGVLGYKPKELLGRSIFEFVHPDDLNRTIATFVTGIKMLAGGRLEVRFRHAAGHYPWLEIVGKPLFDARGAATGAIFGARDITERRQAELYLKESEERFRTLFESAPVGIVIARGGHILLANQTFMFMWDIEDPSELSAKPVVDYFASDYRQEILERIDNLEQGVAAPRLLETFGLKKNDPAFPIYIEIAGLDLSDGPAVVAFISDITDRKLAEERLRESYTRLEKTLEQTVESLSSMAEMRDPYTAGHQVRVAKIACAIASELGMSREQIEAFRMAALIHDIGKTIVPAEILCKPGPLSSLELNFVQAHVQASYDIVKAIEFISPIAEIILQHHERLDGSGYPRGLSGDNILKEARILAVADVIETMASHRPYRPAFPMEAALDEIQKHRGVLYDPEVVDACFSLFQDKGFSLTD